MANRNLTVLFKNQLANDPNYQQAYIDAFIDYCNNVYDTKPWDGFVAGDKARTAAYKGLKGNIPASRNQIRAFLAPFPESANIDDNDTVEQYNATYASLGPYFEVVADIEEADKTTAS